MQKFENMDVIAALEAIMHQNTAYYQSDFAYDIKMLRTVEAVLARQRHKLELLKQRLADASPDKLLARGYSITLKDGKAVKDASQLHAGDILTTRVYQGEITSAVQSIK